MTSCPSCSSGALVCSTQLITRAKELTHPRSGEGRARRFTPLAVLIPAISVFSRNLSDGGKP